MLKLLNLSYKCSKKLKLCMLELNHYFLNTGQVEKQKATKLLSSKRRGFRKLTFICKFSISSKINVSWFYNKHDVKGHKAFKVTNRYKMKKHLLISKLKVVSRVIHSCYLMK